MYQETERTRRVSELVKREVADILLRELGDEHFRLVSVSAVTISRDLRNATVFFTCLGEKYPVSEVEQELNHAKGAIRHELGKRIRMKRVPDLVFRFDESIERGMKLSHLIDSVSAKDEQN